MTTSASPNLPRATLDVSDLPSATLDHRSPIWWGNLLLLFIETTMFGLLAACYFYYKQNFEQWPPPRTNQLPILYNALPDWGLPTVLLALSVIPMALVDRACLQRNTRMVTLGLIIVVLAGIAAVVLRYFEFGANHFQWNDNAYASTVWTILGLHLLHLLTGTGESALMLAWILTHGMDDKHARDIRTTALYWYWIAGIWLIFYLIIYWSPRWSP